MSSKPAHHRSAPRAPRGREVPTKRRPRLTFGRKLLLTAVLALVATMFVPSITTGIRQAQQINALERDNAATEQEIQDLQKKQDNLKDPTYIERKAREDFQYVRPGEEAYIVVNSNNNDESATQANKGARQRPWYEELFDSLKAVGLATEE